MLEMKDERENRATEKEIIEEASQEVHKTPPITHYSLPITADSDNDGYHDDVEIAHGYDPYDPIPCPKKTYSRTTRNVYGGMRFTSLENERCRSAYLRRELERVIGEPLRVSAQRWHELTNAYLYGGYTLKDVAMAAVGIQNIVHPTIMRSKFENI